MPYARKVQDEGNGKGVTRIEGTSGAGYHYRRDSSALTLTHRSESRREECVLYAEKVLE